MPRKKNGTHNNFLPYVLNKVTDKLNSKFLPVLRSHNITLTHWRVLAFLSESDGLGVSALADYTVTDQSTLSRALQQMEKRKLLRRTTRSTDTRFVEIHITDVGHALFDEILPVATKLREEVVANMGRKDTEQLLKLLQKLLLASGNEQ